MARANDSVAELLQEYADLIAITGGEAFRARVYEKAARAVAGYPADVATLDRKGLEAIPNVGGSTAAKIAEYLHSGRIEAVEKLRGRIPAGVRELTRIPGLGPKRAVQLYEQLGVGSVAELVTAIEDGRVTGLRGFGARAVANLQRGIELLAASGGRVLISEAAEVAAGIVGALAAVPGCERVEPAGSLRRMRETIGDVDILAASRDPEPLMAAFAGLPLVADVIVRGPTKTSIRTTTGLQVDLRVVPPEAWGAALQYFTGSQAHNIRVRERAVRAGLTLSEYGLFRADGGELVASGTEEEVYRRLGLPWIPPVLREDRGEVRAALHGELPELIRVEDILGDLHTHTDLTDGVSSLEEMLAAARARGYRYYAVTDHAKDLPMQRMTDAKMLAQRDRLREMAASEDLAGAGGMAGAEGMAGGGMALLHGTELNIGPDGGVDWDADFLAGFDLCVASVHSHFGQDQATMTRRLIRACENPYVTIIGHPTTRLINRRPPVDADWDAVFQAAAQTGTAMEINAFPDRLDLGDELIMRAKARGVRFAIDTDAHASVHLGLLHYGVGTAARGWLTARDVINAWPLEELRAFIDAKRRTG